MNKAEIIKHPVEQVGSNIKKLAWSAVMESLALIILGVLFIVLQDTIVKILAYLIGVFFLVKGGFQIISYYMEKGQNDLFNNGLLSGVISVLIGVALLLVGEDIANVFRVVIGVIIIYESLVRINTASKLSVAKINAWKYILVVALIMLVIGIFVTFNSGAVITLVGWMMIISGIIGIVGDAVFIQYVNKVVDAFAGKSNSEK
ncbi:DUF308 domain-containing protein [Candidatus Saccharibacteria bacterium]|nr:DUF308 domain-containing protein [Candidatus Saccharibacteria bacterium]